MCHDPFGLAEAGVVASTPCLVSRSTTGGGGQRPRYGPPPPAPRPLGENQQTPCVCLPIAAQSGEVAPRLNRGQWRDIEERRQLAPCRALRRVQRPLGENQPHAESKSACSWHHAGPKQAGYKRGKRKRTDRLWSRAQPPSLVSRPDEPPSYTYTYLHLYPWQPRTNGPPWPLSQYTSQFCQVSYFITIFNYSSWRSRFASFGTHNIRSVESHLIPRE